MKITCGTTVAEINGRGELASLSIDGKEYMWNADPAFWDWHSPVLFPYCGRLKNGTTRYAGKAYEGLGIHGFARNAPFTLTQISPSACVAETAWNADTLAVYPYAFVLDLRYEVFSGGVTVTYTVANPGKEEMQYTIGGHPAVLLPARLKNTIAVIETPENAHYYTADANGLAMLTESFGRVDGKILPLKRELFERGGTIFVSPECPSSVSVLDRETQTGFRVSFENFPVLTLWLPTRQEAESPFLCVEPWCGLPDLPDTDGNFESKPFRQTLRAGESRSHVFILEKIG